MFCFSREKDSEQIQKINYSGKITLIKFVSDFFFLPVKLFYVDLLV